MVASNLVKEMIKQVKKGKKTAQKVAIEFVKPCHYGIFNPKRAEGSSKNSYRFRSLTS